jgi:hypothetical protein
MNVKKNNIYLYLGIAGLLFGIGLLFAIRHRRRIVKFSESLIGQREIIGNSGFNNEEFESLMEEVGWDAGDPWCVYFVKLVWYNMAPEWLKAKILSKVSGSSVQTWENLKNDDSFVISAVPKAGDMAIWRYYSAGKPTNNGHAGIVKYLGVGTFTTIEGNTSDTGTNEGYIVAEKTRPLDYTTNNGLRLIGFVRFA